MSEVRFTYPSSPPRRLPPPIRDSDVFTVPGNHDAQRDVAENLVEAARSDSTRLESILADPADRANLVARFANYTAFANSFAQQDAVHWVEERPVDVLDKLRIVGLNTALLCIDDKDNGKLHLAGQQRGELDPGETLSIVVTHHPIDYGWLREQEQLRALFCDRALGTAL